MSAVGAAQGGGWGLPALRRRLRPHKCWLTIVVAAQVGAAFERVLLARSAFRGPPCMGSSNVAWAARPIPAAAASLPAGSPSTATTSCLASSPSDADGFFQQPQQQQWWWAPSSQPAGSL